LVCGLTPVHPDSHPPTTVRHLLIKPALALAAVVTAGCAVAGTGQPADFPAGIVGAGRSTPDVLPSETELASVVDTAIASRGRFPPSAATLGELPDVLLYSRVSPVECLGVTVPFDSTTYRNTHARAVAYHSWDNRDAAVQRPVSFYLMSAGAFALAAPSNAWALFHKFADQWQQCRGKSTRFYNTPSPDDTLFDIAEVKATDAMITAAVIVSDAVNHTPVSLNQRALAVRSNCIVDVEIRQMSWRLGDPVSADFAVKVAALILDKVGMAT
jgi:PknH-like protein